MSQNKYKKEPVKKFFSFLKKTNTLSSTNLKSEARFKSISAFINNSHYYLPIRLFLVILGISFILLAICFKRLPPSVPFYYSLPWGEEQLARPSDLFMIPFAVMVIFLLNFILSILLLKRDYFLVQILMWSSCLIALGGLITLTKIIFLAI